MITTFNFKLFKKRLDLFLEKIEDLGGETDPLTIEKPAIEEEIKNARSADVYPFIIII